MIKPRKKRTKNNMQNILNLENITKWGYFWIG